MSLPSRWAPVFIALLVITCHCLAATTNLTALTLSVDKTGTLSLRLNDDLVCSGKWSLEAPIAPAPNSQTLGKPTQSTITHVSPTGATVVDAYSHARATYTYYLDNEDLHISLHLENTDPSHPLGPIKLGGLTFHFRHSPSGWLPSWHVSFFNYRGESLYYPSELIPIGASYAADDQFGFGVYSATHFCKPHIFHAAYQGQRLFPETPLEMYTLDVIEPNQSLDLDIYLRISTDTSFQHLLGGYKSFYDSKFPKLLYHPDTRPVLEEVVADPTWVRPENPFGFGGEGHRFDTVLGTRHFLNFAVPRMKRVNCRGPLFWALQGENPRGAMFRPDFDLFPAPIAANLPLLIDTLHHNGLEIGLCTRPAENIQPLDARTDTTYRLSAKSPADMKLDIDRYRHALAMGFDFFYCDSMGSMGINDIEILRQLRQALGPDVQLYTEFGCDLSLPYAGRYAQWDGHKLSWADEPIYTILRYLCPDSTWLVVSRDPHEALPPASLHVVPLVGEGALHLLPATRPTAMH